MPDAPLNLATYLLQLPIVAIVIALVFKFLKGMEGEREKFTTALTEERSAFLDALGVERVSREEGHEKLDDTLGGLTTSVNNLGHAVTELRSDVRESNNN